MALLELLKRSEISCRQEGAFGEIWIYAVNTPSDQYLNVSEENREDEEANGSTQS
jgi:chromatin segregation and condensation protein Rec8/ScpA/Scc1 (kleisin family)